MSKYVIEKGVPIPGVPRKTLKSAKHRMTLCFPWNRMSIGDSIFVKCESTDVKSEEFKKLYTKVNGSIQNYMALHPPMRYCLRRLVEKGRLGLRVWRVSSRTFSSNPRP